MYIKIIHYLFPRAEYVYQDSPILQNSGLLRTEDACLNK